MCNCSSSPCGCSTVSGRRGPRGYVGPAGPAGPNAQVIQGSGAPTSDPPDVDGYALYLNEDAAGTYWIWTPGTPGSWTDTGIQVSGTDGVAGGNNFSITAAPFNVPAGPYTGNQSAVLTVQAPNDPLNPNSSGTNWMVDALMSSYGQTIFIEGAGYYRLAGIISPTQAIVITRRNDTTGEYAENAVAPFTVPTGSRVSGGGIQGPAGPTTSITSGAGVPVTDLNDTPGLYVRSGGNYYIWNIAGQAWTDTGIAVTGPAGATGSTGAAGYSPVTTTGTGVPSGGTNGDIYFRQVNDGLLQVYTRAGGVWTAGITVLANRLLGFSNSNPTPNPLGLAANAGDQWWTQIGSSVDMWIYNGASWGLAISFTTGGGGATGNFQQVSDASPVLFNGRRTGTRIWTMERAIQFAPFAVNITSLLTTTLDTQYQWQKISIQVATFALDWSAMVGDVNGEYIFEFTNDTSPPVPTTITYLAGRWTKSPGVTQPVILAAGEVATIHCYQHQGLMNIAFVEQGVTAI